MANKFGETLSGTISVGFFERILQLHYLFSEEYNDWEGIA
jgi:hypothetical protein